MSRNSAIINRLSFIKMSLDGCRKSIIETLRDTIIEYGKEENGVFCVNINESCELPDYPKIRVKGTLVDYWVEVYKLNYSNGDIFIHDHRSGSVYNTDDFRDVPCEDIIELTTYIINHFKHDQD